MEDCILVGGSGAVGQAITQALLDAGRKVTVLDERPPPARLMAAGTQWLETDLLTGDVPALPEGEVVLLLGLVASRPRWPWLLPVRNAISTARIRPALAGRAVLLMSSAEIYGSACAPAKEDPPPVGVRALQAGTGAPGNAGSRCGPADHPAARDHLRNRAGLRHHPPYQAGACRASAAGTARGAQLRAGR